MIQEISLKKTLLKHPAFSFCSFRRKKRKKSSSKISSLPEEQHLVASLILLVCCSVTQLSQLEKP
jgi:hypothetical protein